MCIPEVKTYLSLISEPPQNANIPPGATKLTDHG